MSKLKNTIKSIIRLLQHRPITANITLISPDQTLTGKSVLITGGTSGIGKAIAETFYKAGAYVVITSRNDQKAKNIASEIDPQGKNVIGMSMDNTDIGNLESRFSDIINTLPSKKLDILVNNAGLVGGDIRTTTESEFDSIISTNLKSTFFLSKYCASHMIKNNIKGNIMNVASSSSLRPAVSAYTLSKWGIRGLTEGLAKMFAPHGITVNGVAPGPTATPMLGKSDYSDISHPDIPLRRYALPEEIAAMALFLCGPMGKTIIGDIIYMTGGAGIIEINDIDYTFKI